MQSMAIANNTVLHAWKLLKIALQRSHHIHTMWGARCVLYLGLGDQSLMYMYTKSSCCILGTYTVVFVNYSSINFKNMHMHRQRESWRSLWHTTQDRGFKAVVILTWLITWFYVSICTLMNYLKSFCRMSMNYIFMFKCLGYWPRWPPRSFPLHRAELSPPHPNIFLSELLGQLKPEFRSSAQGISSIKPIIKDSVFGDSVMCFFSRSFVNSNRS